MLVIRMSGAIIEQAVTHIHITNTTPLHGSAFLSLFPPPLTTRMRICLLLWAPLWASRGHRCLRSFPFALLETSFHSFNAHREIKSTKDMNAKGQPYQSAKGDKLTGRRAPTLLRHNGLRQSLRLLSYMAHTHGALRPLDYRGIHDFAARKSRCSPRVRFRSSGECRRVSRCCDLR